MLLVGWRGDEDVVDVDEGVGEALHHPVQQALEGVSGVLASERHP